METIWSECNLRQMDISEYTRPLELFCQAESLTKRMRRIFINQDSVQENGMSPFNAFNPPSLDIDNFFPSNHQNDVQPYRFDFFSGFFQPEQNNSLVHNPQRQQPPSQFQEGHISSRFGRSRVLTTPSIEPREQNNQAHQNSEPYQDNNSQNQSRNQEPPQQYRPLYHPMPFFFRELMQCDVPVKRTKKTKVETKKNTAGETECIICCLDIKKNCKIPDLDCGHIYHLRCLNKWIKKQDSCPLCRRPVLQEC